MQLRQLIFKDYLLSTTNERSARPRIKTFSQSNRLFIFAELPCSLPSLEKGVSKRKCKLVYSGATIDEHEEVKYLL